MKNPLILCIGLKGAEINTVACEGLLNRKYIPICRKINPLGHYISILSGYRYNKAHYIQFARVYNVSRMSSFSKIRPLIYFAAILVIAGLFLMPDPFENVRFPFTDGVRIFDGYTRVNFSTMENETIENVELILWPGEREAFQLLLTRNEGLGDVFIDTGISPEFEPFVHEAGEKDLPSFPGMKVYVEYYIEIEQTNIGRGPLGEYPDALIHFPPRTFKDFGDSPFVTLYIEILSDENVAPGIYGAEVTINIDGEVTSVPISFIVLNILVDAEPLPVAIGVSVSNFNRFTDTDLNDPAAGSQALTLEDIYENFAQRLYEARAFPYNFDTLIHPKVRHGEDGIEISFTRMNQSYQFLFEGCSAKQFPLNVHDVFGSSGVLRGEIFSEEWTRDATSYVLETTRVFRENEWMDDAFCFIVDEPNTEDEYHAAAEIGLYLHELVPDLKYLVTEQPYKLPGQGDWPDLHGIVNIWCPQLGYYRTEECKAVQSDGDEVWIYPNQVDYKRFEPEILSPTLNIGDEFLAPQILTTVIYRHGIDGLLYWDCVYWKHTDPFVDPNPSGNTDREFFGNGDGYLFYPGDRISEHLPGFDNVPGPIPSLRWMNLVQGLEDYRLFSKLGIDPEIIPSSEDMLNNPKQYKELILNLKRGLIPD